MAKAGDLVFSGDIGGTKTYLGLFTAREDRLELAKEGSFLNSNFSGADEIIAGFLEKGEAGRIAGASLGVACTPENNTGRMTNLPWVIDGEGIKKRFKIKNLELINDLVSTGWGVGLLAREDFFVVQTGSVNAGNAALIAAGTGLGESILFWDGAGHTPSGSEGGHADFAPRSDIEIELLQYFKGIFGHVSVERVVSGPGLVGIYDFFKAKRGGKEPQDLKEKLGEGDASAVIANEALHGTDRNCRDALDLFVSAYGAEAGNLALKCMALNGVYIGGGIIPKILKAMEGPNFIGSFKAKGRFEGLLSRIPVRIILNDKTSLIGAAFYASVLAFKGNIKKIKRVVFKKPAGSHMGG